MTQNRFSVAIVGLGNIGMMYDFDMLDDENYLTHLKSFYFHPNFSVRYVIDLDNRKLELAKKRYPEVEYFFNNIDEISTMPDIFVLASLPSINFSLFNKLKDYPEIKLFLIEKPFWNSDFIKEDFRIYFNKCVINYIRKNIPYFITLKENIEKGIYGNVIGVHVLYSKGLRNNGSHFIDFVNFLFNSKYQLDSLNITNCNNDYIDKDLSIGFTLDYIYNGKKFNVIFQIGDERCFSIGEIDIVFENARFRVFDSGGKVEEFVVEEDTIYKNYKKLEPKGIITTSINKYGWFACDNIQRLLTDQTAINWSGLEQESNNYEVIKTIINKK